VVQSLVFLTCLILSCAFPSHASDVTLTITQKNLHDSVLIEILNTSPRDVAIESVEIVLDQRKYISSSQGTIKAAAEKGFIFSIDPPGIEGSYILLTTVRYKNEGALLTVKHADFYHRGQPSLLPQLCTLQITAPADGGGHIRLIAPHAYPWTLVAPDEVETRLVSARDDVATYQARNTRAGFIITNRIFATSEEISGNKHRAAICSSILSLKPTAYSSSKGWIPGYIFIILVAIFFTVTSTLILRDKQSKLGNTILRYGSRMFFLSLSCWILKEIDQWLIFGTQYLTWSPFQWFVSILLDTINGGNYVFFYRYFVDGYFLLCLVFMFPILFMFDGNRSLKEDKYIALFLALLKLPRVIVGKQSAWDDLARLGLLTIMVKFFFTPMMVSWSIGSAFSMVDGFRSFQWNINAINAHLVQLLILVDTVIFSAGYLTESKYLKNEIKSVDPTFFGWIVCLWCYPPFNAFSFKALDFYIIRISLPYPAWLDVIILCVITCLWAIFVWASVALGFKASNLTNRGIVRSGPYRYVRHPAYMAKLMIWILQGVFFGQFGIFILLGFIIIYVLRAWTEERHLSRDPDYLTYKHSVRWWFIPGVI
jgi:protein-S-isoprenylcysteine O-methyltransferase Ste14